MDGNPDFVKLAESYAIRSRRITQDEDIDEAVREMLASTEPYLLECAVSPEEATL